MKLAKHELVAALGLRYDHHSAESMFEAACDRAGLSDQHDYTPAEVSTFRAALARIGDRLQRVDERLESLLGAPTQAPTTPMPAATELVTPTEPPMPAQAPQATAPMPAATELVTPTEPPMPMPAQAPQAPTPMPAAATEAETPPARASLATTPMPPAPSTPTRIVLSGLELEKGERVFLCGDRVEFGTWDPENARELLRDGDVYATTVEPGDGSFKFLCRAADGSLTWEGGENRDVGTAIQIETSWQS